MNRAILILLAAAAGLGAMTPKDGPTGVQYVIRVIEASSEAGALNDASDKVPAELKEILKHTAYTEVGVAILRGREVEFSLGDMMGNIDSKVVDRGGVLVVEFELELMERRKRLEGDEETFDDHVIMETADIARDGETVVLGASSMKGGSQSMIVLMTVKIIR